MNIKLELVEKERSAYIENNPAMSTFFARVLDYVIELEEQINKKDAEIERMWYEGQQEEHEK